MANPGPADIGRVELYWLPVGAGGRFVRTNGRLFEAWLARREHRPAQSAYHSALEVHADGGRWVIEMAPAWGTPPGDRGVVREGPVGAVWLGASVLFRYEVRCWLHGFIPDVAEAVASPMTVSRGAEPARMVLDRVRQVPGPTWGRDELRAGEMWNSNSVVSWLLATTGHDMAAIRPPGNGHAPGWQAGLVVAARG